CPTRPCTSLSNTARSTLFKARTPGKSLVTFLTTTTAGRLKCCLAVAAASPIAATRPLSLRVFRYPFVHVLLHQEAVVADPVLPGYDRMVAPNVHVPGAGLPRLQIPDHNVDRHRSLFGREAALARSDQTLADEVGAYAIARLAEDNRVTRVLSGEFKRPDDRTAHLVVHRDPEVDV